VASVRGVSSGALESCVAPWEETSYDDPLLQGLKEKLIEARKQILETIQFVKQKSTAYLDLSGRRLVDAAIAVICGHLFLGQAARNDRKKRVARRYIEMQLPVIAMNLQQVRAGDMSALEEYELLAGPVPAAE
jgi:hypothetical protein